jgi:phosphoribosylaminoimidazole-succinocarboxamide synthase
MKLGKRSEAANAEVPMGVAIYHDPNCETSRNTFAMIRNAGIEPHVVEYLKTPPPEPSSCISSGSLA